MPFNTRLTELIPGLVHPVVMGGMTLNGGVEFAAAVTNAGALGCYAIMNSGTPEQARTDIRRLKELTNGKPFSLNHTILPSFRALPHDAMAQVIIEEMADS